MKKFIVYVFLGFLIFAAPVMAVDAGDIADEIIEDIRVTGNNTVDDKEIMDTISYGVGMLFSKYKTREDIRAMYETGKFDDVKVYLKDEDGKKVLVYEVVEKPQIGKIFIKGNKDVGEGDIKSKLEESPGEDEPEKEGAAKVREGEYFDEYLLKQAIRNIQKMYKERNFYYADVKYTTEMYGKTGETEKVKIFIEVDEGAKMKIKKITAKGNKVFGADKIRGAMETKEEGWFQAGVFDDDKFIADLKKILTTYYQEGYVKARINGYSFSEIDINRDKIIKDYVSFDKENNAINIEIPVEEGMKYTIKSLEVEGNEVYETGEITGRIDSKAGKIFDRIQFEKDVSVIRSLYAEKGHIFAQVKDNLVYDDDMGEVKISLKITEGQVAYINKIKIRGNYVTKDKIILRELPLEEGEPFDSNKIRIAQERIYNLGFFDNVIIDTEQVDIDRLNLVFEVVERKTGNIGLGAGYSTVEGLVGYVQLSQSNLFGEGKSFNADVQFGSDKKSWQLSYKDPWLFDTPTSFGADVWNIFKTDTYNNQGYDLDTYGFNVSFGRRMGLRQKAYVTYRYQDDTYSNINTDLQGLIKEGKSQVSSITPLYIYDTRDDVFDAGKGIYSSLSLQVGGGILGGDYNYVKGIADFRYFVPSIWKFVLAFHGRIGNATGFAYNYGDAGVPPTEKFYCGGTDTVRGYDERSIGPVGGGNFTIVTNIEYKVKLVERMLTAAVFYDSGNCWGSFDEVDWSNPFLYGGVGMGIRLTIPGTVMLLRLDWGWGLDPSAPDGGKVHFNIGNIF